MIIKTKQFKDVNRAPYNPRVDLEPGMPEYEKLKKSILAFGHVLPLVFNKKSGNLVGGHQTMTVLEEDGRTEAEMSIVDLNDADEKALNIALNKTGGMFDGAKLSEILNELIEIPDFDIEVTGFDLDEIGEIDIGLPTPEASEDNYDADKALDAIVEPITKRGDVILLGSHRLMCGDSTDAEDVEKLMDGKKADCGFNDPPYGMKKENEGVQNDNLNYADLLKFNKVWINLQVDILNDAGSFYCWGTDEPLMDIYSEIIKPLIKTQRATFRNLITWSKGSGQGQNAPEFRMYPISDEKCLFIMMGVQGFNTNADNYFEGWEPVRDYLLQSRLDMGWDVATMKKIVGHSDLYRDHWTSKSQFSFPTREVYGKMQAEANRVRAETGNDAFKKEYDAFKKEYDELKKEYYGTRAYFDNMHDNQNNVWNFKRDVTTKLHATPKPIEVCARAIKSSCPVGGIVVDFFNGSGSCLVTCEQTDRICYAIEIDPAFCDVTIDRWETLTGRKVIRP